MTMTLFPCGATPCACPACTDLIDLTRASPDARVVIWQPADGFAGTLLGGVLTYHLAGSADLVTVTMGVVDSASQLCLGRSQAYMGPLLWTASVPVGAVLVSLYVSYSTDGGSITASWTRNVVDTCTDGSTQVRRVAGSLDCHATPTVAVSGSTCVPCAEATGSSTSVGGVIGHSPLYWYNRSSGSYYNGVTCGSGVDCTANVLGKGYPASSAWSSAPPSWTPSAGSRPCNWTALAFSISLVSTRIYTAPVCSGSFSISQSCTYTKTAGSDVLVVSGSVSQATDILTDNLVRVGNYPNTGADATYDIPCTGYRIRQTTTGDVADVCGAGSAKVISGGPRTYAILEPR